MKQCKYPKLVRHGKKYFKVRCRKCPACKGLRVQQWISRFCFEDAYNPYPPKFVTMTYEVEPDGVDEIREHIQFFFKRIREKGYHVRYFATVEKGSKKKRLHCHAILWTDASSLGYHRLRSMLTKSWKKGYVLLRDMYGGKGGFIYASKYLQKDTIYYTYSRRPGLGGIGRLDFIEKAIDRYARTGRIIERMRLPVLGELLQVRVHSGWMRQIKKILGVKKLPEMDTFIIDVDKPKELEYKQIMEDLLNGKEKN